MKQRSDTMITVAATSGDDVDYRARRLSKFSFITGRQHLKLGDCLLIKLGGSSTINRVLVWLAIDHEVIVSRSLAKHRRGIVGALVRLPIDNDARHQFQQVEVITPIDWHVLYLSWRNRSARRRRGGINQ